MSEIEFVRFPSIPRLSRQCVITEKIDGSNAVVGIGGDGKTIVAGTRSGWITTTDDYKGFAKWVEKNKEELLLLGPGLHRGEWWGNGIGRGYGLKEKRFSLFNTSIWADDTVRPSCCHCVPVLYDGLFLTAAVDSVLENLFIDGSAAAPGFMQPEGIIVYHVAAGVYFKKTIDNNDTGKWSVK